MTCRRRGCIAGGRRDGRSEWLRGGLVVGLESGRFAWRGCR
jgi:hypothetical protein